LENTRPKSGERRSVNLASCKCPGSSFDGDGRCFTVLAITGVETTMYNFFQEKQKTTNKQYQLDVEY
jgi:hypothetical protein